MELAEIVRQLAQALQLPDLSPQADGSAAFRAQGIAVLLAPRPAGEPAFVARARLGALAGDAVQCLPALMSANFFADGIGGAVASLDAQADVYLTQHFDLRSTSFALVLASLERFVAQACRCQALLPSPADAAPPPHDLMGVRA